MPVNSTILQKQLKAIFEAPINQEITAQNINSAIETYLAPALFSTSIPIFTPGKMLPNILDAVKANALAAFVTNLEKGVRFYLTDVLVTGATSPVVTIPPTGTLTILNTQLLTPPTRPALTTQQSSSYIADAIDIMVKTCIAPLIIPPNPAPIPTSLK